MKSLEEIKDEYARELGFGSWDSSTNTLFDYENEIETHTDRVTKRYAEEYAKESLKNASDNFDIEDIEVTEGGIISHDRIQHNILSESNLPKHR